MQTRVQLGEFSADVVRKDIKNVHLSVHPPTGRVRIAAPHRMSLDTVRVFAASKLAWIRRHQRRFIEQERDTAREYLDRESHYVWGKRYLLQVVELEVAPSVMLGHRKLVLAVRPGAGAEKMQAVLDNWYRSQVREAVAPLIAKWERAMRVHVRRVFVRHMKTKWGSCNPRAGSIRLNTELAKKPRECLEYILVHEMVHLLEPTHNARFVRLMDQYIPRWQSQRDILNRLPLRHATWGY